MKESDKNFIKQQLKLLSCTDLQGDIYLNLIRSGSGTIQEISNSLKVNRVTIHSSATELVKKGLIIESRNKKRRILLPAEPEILLNLLTIKENELQQTKANLNYSIKILKDNFTLPTPNKPDINFYQGVDGFKQMLELTLKSKNDFLGLINVEIFSSLLSTNYLKNYFKKRAANGIHSKLIWPDLTNQNNSFIKEILPYQQELKFQVRFLPSEENWGSGFISWNNCLSLKSFSEGQITCSIIKNKDIVKFYREQVFATMWEVAGKFSKQI